MKHMRQRVLALLCAAMLLLPACQKNEAASVTENQVWQTMPTLTYGVLESEKLQVLPWYDGRTEAASQCRMAETELGYYWTLGGYLFYADKVNLSNWVVVCNLPDCDHARNWTYGDVRCNGRTLTDRFLLRGGRLFYESMTGNHPEIRYAEKGRGHILVSKAADGTDIRMEYQLEEAFFGSSGGRSGTAFTSTQWIQSNSILQPDGSYRNVTYRITANGAELIHSSTTAEELQCYVMREGRGDEVFVIGALDPTERTLYRFTGDTLEAIDPGPERGYFSGNTMRVFRSNDGYYDIDLNTKKEVLLAEARFKNSFATILLPNCIIETTLSYQHMDARAPDMTHQMAVFDGERWRSVALPKELESAKATVFTQYYTITSDSIFFIAIDKHKDLYTYGGIIYRINLNQEVLTAQACQQLVMPK